MTTETSDWHGWSNSREPYKGVALHIGKLPGRRSVCLYSINYDRDGALLRTHAFFRSEDEARRALAVLDELLAPRWEAQDRPIR